MQLVCFVQELAEIEEYQQQGVQEVILTDHFLSRQGGSDPHTVIQLAQAAKAYQMQVFFQWDLLFTEEQAPAIAEYWRQHYSEAPQLFDAIRVQDVGALGMVQTLFSTISIHLILETGNRNLVALQRWATVCGDRLGRIVLSTEIPVAQLALYQQSFPGKLELLVVGPILLFYSPRHLLTPLAARQVSPSQALAASEESPHKGFRIVESVHGTLMFHTKDLFLLDVLPQLAALNLAAYRLDLRHFSPEVRSALLPAILTLWRQFTPDSLAKIKQLYPQEITRGFFPVNKTDVLFGKLKIATIRDGRFIGEILQVAREQHLAVKINHGELAIGQQVEIITPEGKRRSLHITWIKNLSLETLERGQSEQVVLINFCNGVSNRSAVYRSH